MREACPARDAVPAPARCRGCFVEPGAAKILRSRVQACPAPCQDLSSHHYAFDLTGESTK